MHVTITVEMPIAGEGEYVSVAELAVAVVVLAEPVVAAVVAVERQNAVAAVAMTHKVEVTGLVEEVAVDLEEHHLAN